jgi:uncharacterized protein YuzE
MQPRVTFDPDTGDAYIYLGESSSGVVKTSVPLWSRNGLLSTLFGRRRPDALESLILDFDHDGRLFGIEIFGSAETVLRRELLQAAEQI